MLTLTGLGRPSRFSHSALLALACVIGWSPLQAQAPSNQQFGKTIAQNAAELRRYTFKQRTEVRLDGEVKTVKLDQIRFDVDGKPQRTTLTAPAEPPKARGIRGKVIAKKREEMVEYIERLMSLAQRYLAPAPSNLEKLSEKAEFSKVQGATGDQIRIKADDFVKTGDSFVWMLDAVEIKPVRMEVRTELDGDLVTITADYRTLPGGPNYVARATVKAKSKELEVKVESFGHERN